MAILKLQQAGESATFRVVKAELVEGRYGQQVKFESDSGDVLYISAETAQRQLARIPLDVDTCAGETLTFSRSENPKGGAPYWNITLADAVDRSQPVEPKRVASPYAGKPIAGIDDFPSEAYGESVADPTPPVRTTTSHTQAVAPNATEKMRLANAYVDLFKFMKVQTGMQDEQALQAATATVWIAWGKGGLV